jgi:sulfate adenylyltransferase subunit 1
MALPSGLTSIIKSIDIFEKSIDEVFAPQSATITLEDDIDISRGDMIVKTDNLPQNSQDIELTLCWLNEKPMNLNSKYHLKHTSSDARCIIKEIVFKMDISSLTENYDDKTMKMNDIARVKIRTTKPLFFDSYRRNRITGSLILVEEGTNETVGAGMIV